MASRIRIEFRMRTISFAIPLLILFFGASCADWLILPPAPSEAQNTATRRTFDYEGRAVETFTARSPGAVNHEPRAFVLRFTGGDAAGAAAYTASRWKQRPVEVWVVNYPGYGGSDRPRTLRALAHVALASFDELKRVAGDRPIFVEDSVLAQRRRCVSRRADL